MTSASHTIPYSHLQTLAERGQTALTKLATLRKAAEEKMGVALEALEVSAAAFGLGVLRGRYGTVEVVGLPADLLAAIGLHVFGFAAGGKYEEHWHHLANGAMGAWLNTLGAGVGAKMLQKQAQPAQLGTPASVSAGTLAPASAMYGALPARRGAAEIIDMAHAAIGRAA